MTSPATPAAAPVTLEGMRRVVVVKSFERFLAYVWVEQTDKGPVRFEMWPHLLGMARVMPVQRLLVWGKSRKVGASWEVAAYSLWKAMYHPSSDALLMSIKKEDAQELLSKCRYVYDHLPDWLKVPVQGSDNKSVMEFISGSKIKSIPSGLGAGRGEDVSLVVQDEGDFHPYFEENFAAITPVIEQGGQVFLVSTSNPDRMMGRFKKFYREGVQLDDVVMAGAKGFKPVRGWASVFTGWRARPGRAETFVQDEMETLGLTPFEAEKEYAERREDFFSAPQSAMYFSREAVGWQRENVGPPRETRLGGAVRIWKPPRVGGRYVAGADLAWGEKGAFDCCVIVDNQTLEQVAEVYGRLADHEMAKLLMETCMEYNRAYLGVEANSEGINVANLLVELGYGDRMYHRGEDWRTNRQQRGWWTTPANRPDILGVLDQFLRQGQVVMRCEEGLGEFMDFIRDEKGKPGPAEGSHSDHVMAWAITLRMREYARFYTVPVAGGRLLVAPRRF